jgi:transposase, IS30 family
LNRKEGDLILGARHQSAIATLVERSTRYVMLAHLPDGYAAEQVKDALVATMTTLPTHLRRSLTWDQRVEMGAHHLITMATDMPIYFCDPGSPWQRGSNENTVSVVPACCSQVRRGWCRQREVALENTGRPSRRAFRWTRPSGCRHRPGPLVLA